MPYTKSSMMLKGYKPIKGFENYMIHDSGLVFSLKRQRFLTPKKVGKKHPQVGLYDKEGNRKSLYVARLVFEHFSMYANLLKPRMKVLHYDKDTLNCEKTNLYILINGEMKF